jgi:Glutathione S-transferase, C-terminal domain/Outer mitochondrial membrane transport complex protein
MNSTTAATTTTNRQVSARLYTGTGGWGLPTIDPDALSAHALLRFTDIPYSAVAAPSSIAEPPVTVVLARNSSSTSSSRATSSSAALAASAEAAHGFAGLVGLLAADPALPDPNQSLTPFMTAESTAFATLVSARFAPARLYEFYIKPCNYDDIYHKILSHAGPFPLNRIVPFLRRRAMHKAFFSSGKSPTEAYFDAGIALAALSTRLGDRNKYFYGDKPSVLDAVVFGQLAVVLFVPLPDGQLRAMVAAHTNLVNFVRRIKEECFPEDARLGWGGDLDADEIAQARRAGADRLAAEQRRAEAEAGAAARAAQRDGQARDDDGDTSKNHEELDDDAVRRRNNAYFIYASVAVFAAHLLFGNEIEFEIGSS